MPFNKVDERLNVDRRSYLGDYRVVEGLPLNIQGRTGLYGRGVLGRWGPNHAGDPVVTRSEYSYTVLSLIEVHYLTEVHPPFSGILHGKLSVATYLKCLWLPDLSRVWSAFINTNVKKFTDSIHSVSMFVGFNHMLHHFQHERNTKSSYSCLCEQWCNSVD